MANNQLATHDGHEQREPVALTQRGVMRGRVIRRAPRQQGQHSPDALQERDANGSDTGIQEHRNG